MKSMNFNEQINSHEVSKQNLMNIRRELSNSMHSLRRASNRRAPALKFNFRLIAVQSIISMNEI